MPPADCYASPRVVNDLKDCYFYHTTDVPGRGLISGAWDLRQGIRDYLGSVDFRNQRVLDVGAASGFLTFAMEQQGAEVVSYDLSPDHRWDVVPYAGTDVRGYFEKHRDHLRQLNNGYWLCHQAFRSQARMVHGTIYTVPAAIGPVDIASLGSILLHVRDPFLALQKVLRIVRHQVIIADIVPRRQLVHWFLGRFFKPRMSFLPEYEKGEPADTWWCLSPELIRRFIAVLGFEETKINYHYQYFQGSRRLLYTIVGQRTKEAPVMPDEESISLAA